MTTPYDTPMEPTFELLGENRYTLEQGIAETVAWLRNTRDTGEGGGGF